jgi:hypothetical protein
MDQQLPEAIFMQQQSSEALAQAAGPDLETFHECEKPDFFSARLQKRRYLYALRWASIRALITEPCYVSLPLLQEEALRSAAHRYIAATPQRARRDAAARAS